jgi:inner membrane protein
MPWAFWGLAAILPIIPDLDVFSMAAYNAPLGHRGITHSLVFALLLGVIVAGAVSRYFRVRWCVLFFWPMGGRYGNWGPIPVSDIALELPDPRYSRAVRSELLWVWLPTSLVIGLVMAWRYHRRRSPC